MEPVDAKQAEEIMRFALFREVPKRQRRKKRKLNSGAAVKKGGSDGSGDEDDDSDDSDDDQDLTAAGERMSTPRPATAGAALRPSVPPISQPPRDPIWGDDSQNTTMAIDDELSSSVPSGLSGSGGIRPER